MRNILIKIGFCSLVLLHSHTIIAAKAITSTQDILNYLQKNSRPAFDNSKMSFKEVSKARDFRKTYHIKYQQLFDDTEILGAQVIKHIPDERNALVGSQTTANGLIYDDFLADLGPKPSNKNESAAIAFLQRNFIHKNSEIYKKPIIFVDDKQKAHWAYLINFYFLKGQEPVAPSYIIDAHDFKIFQTWNDIQHLTPEKAGGFGGNPKLGKLSYDGKKYPALSVLRDERANICYLKNNEVTIYDFRKDNALAQFECVQKRSEHNGLYWNAGDDAVNGGFSPNNDALFAGNLIKKMYADWYHVPVLVRYNNKPMVLEMVTHFYDRRIGSDNAMWDPYKNKMFFGDGENTFYPLTSIGVAAHEVSHGFTQQNSSLLYFEQSGGINESFSDMAAQAIEFYFSGKNSWEIGSEIKKSNDALRYFEDPTLDCKGREPGNHCSIAHVKDYHEKMNVHNSSGIYNHVFYLLAKKHHWGVKKTFEVMIRANRFYWTPAATFELAACGVLYATQDLNYEVKAVDAAFSAVGIELGECSRDSSPMQSAR